MSDVDTQDQQQTDTSDQQTQETGNWYDGLSPDLKNNPTVQKYSNNEEQIKGHLALQKTLGTDRVAIPKDANDTDAWAKINGIRGVPDNAEGYKLNAVKAPEGMDKEFDRFAFQEQMKEINASPAQAQKMWENHTSMLTNGAAAASEQFKSQVEDAKAVMMQEHGEAYESMGHCREFIESTTLNLYFMRVIKPLSNVRLIPIV